MNFIPKASFAHSILIICGFLGLMALGRNAGQVALSKAGDTAAVLTPNAQPGSPYPSTTSDLMVVFVGRESCVYSKRESVRKAWGLAEATVREEGAQRGISVSSIGISLDDDVDVGVAFLTEFGEFDEMVAGGGWRSVGAGELLGKRLAEVSPQLLFIERGDASASHVPGNVTTRLRLVGEEEIVRWLFSGGRIPSLIPASRSPVDRAPRT